MKVLIVEDDLVIAENNREMIIDFGFHDVTISQEKDDAIQLINENSYDLVLLDARLESGMEGLDLGHHLNEVHKVPFIYLTANTDLESVRNMMASKPIAYLSKPIRKSELYAAISLVLQQPVKKEDVVYSIKDGAAIFRFSKDKFLYAQSSGNYIRIKLEDKNKNYLIRMSLESLLQEISDDDFVRVSRFYVVNTLKIAELKKRTLIIGDEKISYSRMNYEEIKEKLTEKL